MMILNDAKAAWQLNDGGSGKTVRSALDGGIEAVNKWGVWLKDNTFGFALDFSTEGSRAYAETVGFDLEDSFTISAWVKAPAREAHDRVIASGGALKANCWELYIGYPSGEVGFTAKGLTQQPGLSGAKITDGRWHHVCVSYDASKIIIYVDGNAVKTTECTGKIYVTDDIYLGCAVNGENGLDGSLAQVAFYTVPKTPQEVTDTVIGEECTKPRLNLKKGLVLDRCQARIAQPEPLSKSSYCPWDPICVKMLGFDHIKLVFTPHHSEGKDGELLEDQLVYITGAVDAAVDAGIPCILCIHPEPNFKQTGLQEGSHFDRLLRWYSEFALYFKNHWSPDTVALQLMTEPFADTPEDRWTWFSDRIWGTVRNVMPEHTLITSSDTAGNLERVKAMSPTTDTNLIYSFTTYEPYVPGFNALKGLGEEVSIWNFIRNIKYPVEPGMKQDEIDALVEDNVYLVPEEKKAEARKYMYAYYKGEFDGNEFYVNHYDLTYNADWNMLRMKSLDNWRRRYGGNIHIMCVEFGCMDEYIARARFRAVEGSGLDAKTRIKHIGDLRRSFEAFDIGWSYWSYNEAFTVFKPEIRDSGYSPKPEELPPLVDFELMTQALGVTPTFEEPKE